MYARSVCLVTASAFMCCSMAFAQMSAAEQFPQETMPAWARAAGPGRHHTILEDELNHAFRIGGPQQAPPSESAVVTLHQLAHEVPGKAMKEYQRALKAEDKGDRQGAIEHLQKAIQIDPEFCAARNDLGANYLFTNRVDLAIEQFNKTIAIDPHAAMPYSNLAVAFLMQNRLQDAERAAREPSRSRENVPSRTSACGGRPACESSSESATIAPRATAPRRSRREHPPPGERYEPECGSKSSCSSSMCSATAEAICSTSHQPVQSTSE